MHLLVLASGGASHR